MRSATFNLGVLQGLARRGLLDKFDYLSTVSGGGFIGSWLTAWIYRAGEARKQNGGENADPNQGLKDVLNELNQQPPPLNPEPKPLYNLRVYANYLNPKKGLMSADSWTPDRDLLAQPLSELVRVHTGDHGVSSPAENLAGPGEE